MYGCDQCELCEMGGCTRCCSCGYSFIKEFEIIDKIFSIEHACQCPESQHLIVCPNCHRPVVPNVAQPKWTGERFECMCVSPAYKITSDRKLCLYCWGEIISH